MIIIPREKPVIENLNSYYLHVQKLFEHFQGEFGSGGIHFKSSTVEGIIFFDENNLLSGSYSEKGRILNGRSAIQPLIETASNNNFAVEIYPIEADLIYFWANVPHAEELYKDLSSEFTELRGLIKKMTSEKLTGLIDVAIDNTAESGLIFFSSGNLIGTSCSWRNSTDSARKDGYTELLARCEKHGGTFNVKRISLSKLKSEPKSPSQQSGITLNVDGNEGAPRNAPLESTGSQPYRKKQPSRQTRFPDTLTLVQDLLNLFEKTVRDQKKLNCDFETVLRKKFIQKANTYDFLDPFAAEFEYKGGKVNFTGKAESSRLAHGIVECTRELAEELGVFENLKRKSGVWGKKYKRQLAEFGCRL